MSKIVSLLVFVCGAYVISLPISPAYISASILISILILMFSFRGKVSIFGSSLISAALIFLLAAQLVFSNIEAFGVWLSLFSGLLLFLLLVSNLRVVVRYKNLPLAYCLACFFLSFVDISSRIFITEYFDEYVANAPNPDAISWFYRFKIGGVLYQDSNFTAMYLLSGLAVSLLINNQKFRRGLFFIFLCLIALTLSRAAILAVAVCTVAFHVRSIFTKIMLIGAACVLLLLLFVFNDGSAVSKIYIFEVFINYLTNVNVCDLVFGAGWGRAQDVLGIGAHNVIILIFVEGGFLFAFLFLWLMLVLFVRFRQSRYFIAMYFLAGMSFGNFLIWYFLAVFLVTFYQRHTCQILPSKVPSNTGDMS